MQIRVHPVGTGQVCACSAGNCCWPTLLFSCISANSSEGRSRPASHAAHHQLSQAASQAVCGGPHISKAASTSSQERCPYLCEDCQGPEDAHLPPGLGACSTGQATSLGQGLRAGT